MSFEKSIKNTIWKKQIKHYLCIRLKIFTYGYKTGFNR